MAEGHSSPRLRLPYSVSGKTFIYSAELLRKCVGNVTTFRNEIVNDLKSQWEIVNN